MGFEDRLKEEHGEFRRMLARLSDIAAEDEGLRAETYASLTTRLEAHERAEEETIYEAMQKDDDLRDLALEALEQHRIGRVLMSELEKVDLDDEMWLPKLRAIRGLLENHMLIEEGLVVPMAKEVLGPEAMGHFDRRFEEWGKRAVRSMASGPTT